MNTGARVLATIGLLLVLASCGSDGDAGDSAADSSPTQAADSSPTQAADTVTSVTLERSGGLKGAGTQVTRSFVVGQQPPRGFTAAEQVDVVEAAQLLLDSGVALADLPASTCCDRYTYVVEIETADGGSTTFTALDGEPQPGVFSDLLDQLS